MIDYLSHAAALEAMIAALGAIPPTSGAAAAATSTINAVNNRTGAAALGAITDHLLEHADGTADELSLLGTAAALYQRGLAAVTLVAELRVDLEGAIADPEAPGALDRYNNSVARARTELPKVEDLITSATAFSDSVGEPSYLRPHGAQSDLPLNQWPWRDVLMSRRTDAFTEALQDLSDGSDSHRAFAFGAFSGYAGNAVASGYLNAVVGGPRRAHAMRHRLAKYAVGGYLEWSGLAPTLADLRTLLEQVAPAGTPLPAELEWLVRGALESTYGLGPKPPAPDLQAGFQRLLEHLDLLGRFPRPPLPFGMMSVLAIRSGPAGSVPGAGLNTKHSSGAGDGESPVPVASIEIPSGCSAKCKRERICAIIFFVGAAIAIYLFGSGGSGTSAPGSDPTRVDRMSSQSELTAYAVSPNAIGMLTTLHDIHHALWMALTAALAYLKVLGLIYPDELDAVEPPTATFTTLAGGAGSAFPLLAGPGTYVSPPSSATEQPATVPSPYPAGADPTVFLGPSGAFDTISSFGGTLWRLYAEGAVADEQRTNFNLDGDRGFLSRCWSVVAGGSIKDSPVPAVELNYNDV